MKNYIKFNIFETNLKNSNSIVTNSFEADFSIGEFTNYQIEKEVIENSLIELNNKIEYLVMATYKNSITEPKNTYIDSIFAIKKEELEHNIGDFLKQRILVNSNGTFILHNFVQDEKSKDILKNLKEEIVELGYFIDHITSVNENSTKIFQEENIDFFKFDNSKSQLYLEKIREIKISKTEGNIKKKNL